MVIVVMCRLPDWILRKCLENLILLWPFAVLGICAYHISRTLHARILKFYIWVHYKKIADPFFFSCPVYLYFQNYAFKNLVSRISQEVFKLGS